MGTRYFTPKLFSFLRHLAAHNDREWFAANRDDYETFLREPARWFIADAAPHLAGVSPHLVADPSKVGGSLLRIQRDVRFSPDRRPYRSYLGIHFRHERWNETHTPSIYLAFQPRGSYMGVGSWRPDGGTALAIRRAIVDRPDVWEKAVRSEEFREVFTLVGDRLKRPPRGFDPGHPFVDDLRRKDFAGAAPLTQDMITSAELMERFVGHARRAASLLEFLAQASGVPF